MREHHRKLNRILVVCLLSMALFAGCEQPSDTWQRAVKGLEIVSEKAKDTIFDIFGTGNYGIDNSDTGDSDIDVSVGEQSAASMGEQSGDSAKRQEQTVTERYAYEQLSEEGQQTYDKMLSAILNYEEKVALDIRDTKLMKKAYAALTSDHGELFWVEGYSFTRYTKGTELVGLDFAPNYTMTEPEMEEKQRQVDAVAAEWLAGSSPSASDYEKAKYVFETLIRQVDYVEEASDSQNILSVFLNRQTVCQGYACATQYLLRQLGIASSIVTGEASDGAGGGLHAWNLVKLDGAYYYMDTTWGNGAYHMAGNGEQGKFVNYNFLCMTDAEAANFYRADRQISLPVCSSMENNYYVREGRYFESWDPEAIGAVLRAAWEDGSGSVSIKCASAELCEKVKDYFITQEKIADYCRRIQNVYYMESPEFFVITVNF